MEDFHHAEILAADDCAGARVFTDVNARVAGISDVRVVDASELAEAKGGMDLVVTNPSWICDDGARSAGLVDGAMEHIGSSGTLMPHATAAIACGVDRFRRAIEPRLRANGFSWTDEQLDPDIAGEAFDPAAHAGVDRIAAVWLCATRRN